MYNDLICNFILTSLDNGWSIKKEKDNYVFTKKHNNKKEIFSEKYLKRFIKENIKI